MAIETLYERVHTQMDRFDRCIAEAERRVELQEELIRAASVVGHNTSAETFELQKLQLLVTILREARQRMYGHPSPSDSDYGREQRDLRSVPAAGNVS